MLSEKQLLTLSRFAYYDVPDALLKRIGAGLTAEEIAKYSMEHPQKCVTAPEELLREILSDDALRDLTLVDYRNDNAASGMVAFGWKAGDEAIVVFRGSEFDAECGVDGRDWSDNLMAPFRGSVQYEGAGRFANRYKGMPLTITGHSKGANLAMVALAKSRNPDARCTCFDGQGFARDTFTEDEKRALSQRAINYVQQDDPVGALLYHPEKRVFVQGQGDKHPHAPESLRFDEAGNPVPAQRTQRSRAIEALSKSYIRVRDLYATDAVPGWIRMLTGM